MNGMDSVPNAAHRLLETLLAWGVRDVFACPGSTEAPFLDASIDYPELRIWITTHEVTAVAMADGFARVSGGKPGVAFLHTSVGLANGAGGLYAAQIGHSPVLVLTGLKSLAIQSRRGFTAPPNVRDLARGSTKWEWQSLSSDEIADDTARALQMACTGPYGPVWLGLPEDLLANSAPTPPREVTPDRRLFASSGPADEAIERAAALLLRSRNPVLVAGSDISRDHANALLLEVADLLDAPVFHEDRRSFERSVVPTDYSRYRGLYVPDHPLVLNADVIAYLGARCFHEFERSSTMPPPKGAAVIHSNTDPDEIAKTYGADVGLPGNQRLTLSSLIRVLRSARRQVKRSEEVDVAHPVVRKTTLVGTRRNHLTVEDVVAEVAVLMNASTTVIADATTSNAAFVRDLPQTRSDQLLTTSSGALGWGMGAALGVQLAQPENKVVAVVGDGSFQFGIQALAVAARESVPVLFLVVNNESYAAVAAGLHRFGGRALETATYPGKDISGPNIASIAIGFGIDSVRVRDVASLRAALEAQFKSNLPALIEVMTDTNDLGPV